MLASVCGPTFLYRVIRDVQADTNDIDLALSYVDINRVFVDNIRNVPPCFKFDIRQALFMSTR